jgi:GNAT superfamily N-acetyltransferase
MQGISLDRATEDQFPAIYGILALAGEHMHRVLGLSHWHPFPSFEDFLPHLEDRDVYAVHADRLLVGTFNLGIIPESYYLEDMSDYWRNVNAEAMYFSGFAIVPSHQQQGIGSWCMAQADRLAQEKNFRYLRFDGVSNHARLMQFYTRLSYRPCGLLPVTEDISVMCFEKEYDSANYPS